MNLYDKYKAIYKEAASAIDNKQFKLIYEKNGDIYGSVSGIPSNADHCFSTLNKRPKVAEPAVKEPDMTTIVTEETTANAVVEDTRATEVIADTEELEAPRSKRSRKQKVVTEEIVEAAE